MPGILPMKVIRVGTSAQSRIAQACDRCRSKKIRCDGVTPCCSQCSNVGFECKTSDKLSRRAFPRGYTESLEDRVRTLEGEVKELKDLLDKKDEQIDILSRIRPNPQLHERPAKPNSPPSVLEDKPVDEKAKTADDMFQVRNPPYLLSSDHHDTVLMGASSTISFVDAFKTKLEESDRFCSTFKPEVFFGPYRNVTPPSKGLNPTSNHEISKAPPRLVSDQMVNIFFQEWAPLFPVLHRPTFLNLYDKYMKNPEEVDHHSVAQLNLVFGIAALSAGCNQQDADEFERQWQTAIDAVLHDVSLPTLQCLVLAQIYCIVKAEYSRLLFYKGIAIILSYRLGLHQSQENFSLGAFATETRKKVFWVLYTLDCFSAAMLGLPKLMNESYVHIEYPSDVDDENVCEQGFQSTLPGEPTRLSSALALFRVARILSKVLDEVYPARSSHELSLERTNALNEELGVWLQSLAPQHRLKFVQEKPSTDIVGSRSPLLSLAYHYIRILIHRPVLGSDLGAKLSLMNLATSSKYIIQIAQLLEDRHMSFSFCLNRNELLLVAGFGLLFQGMDLNRKGKWIQDSQRLVRYAIDLMERNGGSGTEEFRQLASFMINVNGETKAAQPLKADSKTRRKSDSGLPTPKIGAKSARKQLQALTSRFSNPSRAMKTGNLKSSRQPKPPASDSLASNPHFFDRNESQNSVSSVVSDPTAEQGYLDTVTSISACQAPSNAPPNYDFLVSHELMPYFSLPSMASEPSTKESDYGLVATQQSNGPPCESVFNSSPVLSSYVPVSQAAYDWPVEVWELPSDLQAIPPSARSVLSLSEEEVTSGEELSICDQSGNFQGILIPTVDGYGSLDGFEYRL